MSFLFNCYAGIYDSFMKRFKLDNNEEVIKLIKGKDNRICDVGGGTGVLGSVLEKKGNKVTIVDPCTKMTDIAVKRNKNISIISSTLIQSTYEETFDYIIFKDSLHHIKDQEKTIEKSIELLSNNGYIIIQEFSPRSIQGKIIFAFERFCLEKITPVNEKYLLGKMKDFGIQGEIIIINKRDYIFLGKKVKKCQR